MELALPGDQALLKDSAAAARPECAEERQGSGHSMGINIAPGSEDDGWVVPPPVRLDDGTMIQLYKDGEALHAAYNAIEQARRRICLEVYIFASDDTGLAFSDLLCRKAQEGVRVYVIYDSFGSIGSDREMFRRMRRSGIQLEEFHPIRPWECRYSWRPANRDHRKLLVIDEEIAGLGGLNVGREYAGSWVGSSGDECADGKGRQCDFWRDNAVGLRGPAARHFQRAFARTWHYISHGGKIRTAEFTYGIDLNPHRRWTHSGTGDRGRRKGGEVTLYPQAPRGENHLSILASVPTLASPLRPLLHELLSGARQSIQMTMAYFAPDDDLIEALCGAARRGVRVQLMLPARCDVNALLIAARSFYERLLSAGVEVYERQQVVLHAKTMTIDGRITTIGSTNLDYRSIEYNLELSAIIRSEQFGRQMHALFANDMRFARRINLKEWRRRPWRDRLTQWAVSRARYLL